MKHPLIFLIFITVIYSCNSTKMQVKREFNRVAFDKQYILIELPLYSSATMYYDAVMSELHGDGFVKLIKYTKTQAPVYELTENGYPFFVRDYYLPQRDSEHIAVFKGYQLKKIEINGFKYLNNNEDSLEISVLAKYDVTPILSNEKTVSLVYNVLYVKEKNKWMINSLWDLYHKVYQLPNESGLLRRSMDNIPNENYKDWKDFVNRFYKKSKAKRKK